MSDYSIKLGDSVGYYDGSGYGRGDGDGDGNG